MILSLKKSFILFPSITGKLPADIERGRNCVQKYFQTYLKLQNKMYFIAYNRYDETTNFLKVNWSKYFCSNRQRNPSNIWSALQLFPWAAIVRNEITPAVDEFVWHATLVSSVGVSVMIRTSAPREHVELVQFDRVCAVMVNDDFC